MPSRSDAHAPNDVSSPLAFTPNRVAQGASFRAPTRSSRGGQLARRVVARGVPTMLANNHAADHTNWFFGGGGVSDMEQAITAWMRVHLMDDTSLRGWFYGASCELCGDSAWSVERKGMD